MEIDEILGMLVRCSHGFRTSAIGERLWEVDLDEFRKLLEQKQNQKVQEKLSQ